MENKEITLQQIIKCSAVFAKFWAGDPTKSTSKELSALAYRHLDRILMLSLYTERGVYGDSYMRYKDFLFLTTFVLITARMLASQAEAIVDR